MGDPKDKINLIWYNIRVI